MERWIRGLRPASKDVAVDVANDWDAEFRARHTERKARVAPYRELVDEISALLFRHDPIGINFEDNTDEYDPEAETIVLRLVDSGTDLSVEQTEVVVHEEFVHWFGDGVAGPVDRYRKIAQEIRELWRPARKTGADE